MKAPEIASARTNSVFKYVRHHDVERWAALGWRDTGALRGTHHGEYSQLMEWSGEGEPVFPPETMR
ncbi:hypothetical protein [Afipia sp. DC4300-2b1]|uniref:hypothetical protein n=1 Tax=Afipia sp. DC4300-2b1 TaxID=2804672 RepID=UPI003CE693E1